MSIAISSLGDGKLNSTGFETLFSTLPHGKSAVVRNIRFVNLAPVAVELTVQYVRTTGSSSATARNIVPSPVLVPSYGLFVIDEELTLEHRSGSSEVSD